MVGDRIFDHYQFGKAIRLCPEAPAPVLHISEERTCEGGASLVAANLQSLIGVGNVLTAFGSASYKNRVFADRTLICRIDRDRHSVLDAKAYWDQILGLAASCDVVVVGDYSKGAISPAISSGLLALRKPLFVDAKHDANRYTGCFAIFPNEDEHADLKAKDFQHIIRKLGPRGCTVDHYPIPTKPQYVYDVTGAGDVFLAAFVAKFTTIGKQFYREHSLDVEDLKDCARYANVAAGISVRFLGTHVVTPSEIEKELEVL